MKAGLCSSLFVPTPISATERGRTVVVKEFEKTFAQWLGAASAFAFWKGRVALYAILRGLGVGEGDEVILPGYTCVMNVNPVKYVGAKPIYVDIEPLTYNINPRLIEPKITARTKVIIAQRRHVPHESLLHLPRRRTHGARTPWPNLRYPNTTRRTCQGFCLAGGGRAALPPPGAQPASSGLCPTGRQGLARMSGGAQAEPERRGSKAPQPPESVDQV